MKVRKNLIFHGQVQGVGFRWYCTNYANTKGLTGWVQNLSNGTVEAEIQGNPEAIKDLIEFLSSRSYIVIDEIEEKDMPLKTDELLFQEKGW